jgi:thiol-disulfide isomerase/thioredoxin
VVASSTAEAEARKNVKLDDSQLGFEKEEVGSTAYLNRHNTQMFESGRSFSGNERNKVWLNRGDGTFADLSDLSGADSPNDGRGVLSADFDDDGDVDLFVHNLQRERHSLYRNDLGTEPGFVKLRLWATSSQYEAIGATVHVTAGGRTTAQVLSRGAGFVSCQVPELVFGLAGASECTVKVRWLSGELEDFGTLEAGTRALLREGSSRAEPVVARPRRLPDPLPLGFRINVGASFPRLAVLDAAGQPTLFDPAGEGKLYVNFWASYCTSCIQELPDLQDIHEGDDVRVVAISMDTPEDRERAIQLLDRRGASFPGYYLGAEQAAAGSSLVEELIDLDRLPIPSTVIVGADGTIEEIISGPIETE